MLVKERIKTQIDLILSFLDELEGEKSYRGIERLLQLVLQALLDLGLMLISARGGSPPGTYREVGKKLEELGFIGKEEADFLEEAAGMRNLLVHAYARIDPEIVIKASREEIPKKTLKILRIIKDKVEFLNLDPSFKNILRGVFKGKVKAAFLYGSRVKGYTLRGDYDIAIYFGRPYEFRELARLALEISKTLNVPLELVDLTPLDSASPSLIIEALSGEPIYYENEENFFEIKYRLLREALDVKWVEEVYFSRLRRKYLD